MRRRASATSLSPDTWQAFSATDRAAANLKAYRYSHQVAESAGDMLTGILSLQGVTSNMMRDPGWRMIGTGRAVERGLQLCHLLAATATVRRGIDVDRDVLTSVLTAAESAVTHRRRYRGYVRVGGVLGCRCSSRRTRGHWPSGSPAARPPGRDARLDRIDPARTSARRPRRRARTGRRRSPTVTEGENRPNLERFLTGYIGQLSRFADAVGELHFAAGPTPRAFGFTAVGP
ncbi:alpha-E domain-containing protein [Aeromicrobium sp. UC242_57]|uniref:alpha-E domain-containing protein n=1 Tax=Aeromicrobium sp. UC242_57 TaxID=3374624 RepID=UPI0037B62204